MLAKQLIPCLPILFLFTVHAWDPPKCDSTRYRKEWRTLAPEEQQSYMKSVKKLMDNKFYDGHSKLHGDLSHIGKKGGYIHGSACFLPWHRWFVWSFEEEMRKDDSSLTVPYWDSAYDSQAPELAPIWGDDMFGGNGVGSDCCVVTGYFKDWRPQHPVPHCFKRVWDGGDMIRSFASPEIINSLMSRTKGDYNAFRDSIEDHPHGFVHNNIGGELRSMNSPNDPIFYLHHSNIDRWWWKWQKADPSNTVAYGGINKPCNEVAVETKADKSDFLYGLPNDLKIRVEELLDIKKLCYEYKEMTIEDAKVVELPPPKTGDTTTGTERLIRRAKEFISPLVRLVYRSDDKADSEPVSDKPPEKADPTAVLEKASDEAAPLKPQTKVEVIKSVDPKVKSAVIKPIDEHVTVAKAPVAVHGNDTDRKLLNKLRDISPIPEHWAVLNGINITKLRIHEKMLQNATLEVNKVPGYVSKSALWNRPDMMVKIVEKKGSDEFAVDVNGTRVVVTKGTGSKTNPEQTASNIIGRVKESVQGKVQQPIAIVAENLAKIIGPPLSKDAKDASNPFAARVEGEKGISKDSPTGKKLEEKIHVVPIQQLEKNVTRDDVKSLNNTAKNVEEKSAEKQIEYAKKSEKLAEEGKKRRDNKEEEKKSEDKEEEEKSEDKNKKQNKKDKEKKEDKDIEGKKEDKDNEKQEKRNEEQDKDEESKSKKQQEKEKNKEEEKEKEKDKEEEKERENKDEEQREEKE